MQVLRSQCARLPSRHPGHEQHDVPWRYYPSAQHFARELRHRLLIIAVPHSLTRCKHAEGIYSNPLHGNPVHAGAHATVPRLYHGVSTLVASGAIWTGGTNPQVNNVVSLPWTKFPPAAPCQAVVRFCRHADAKQLCQVLRVVTSIAIQPAEHAPVPLGCWVSMECCAGRLPVPERPCQLCVSWRHHSYLLTSFRPKVMVTL